MARKNRIHYKGAIYHVIVRGNNREAVFGNDSQKDKYIPSGLIVVTIGFGMYFNKDIRPSCVPMIATCYSL